MNKRAGGKIAVVLIFFILFVMVFYFLKFSTTGRGVQEAEKRVVELTEEATANLESTEPEKTTFELYLMIGKDKSLDADVECLERYKKEFGGLDVKCTSEQIKVAENSETLMASWEIKCNCE